MWILGFFVVRRLGRVECIVLSVLRVGVIGFWIITGEMVRFVFDIRWVFGRYEFMGVLG